jgi:histidinol-phosphate phosphatase family protein
VRGRPRGRGTLKPGADARGRPAVFLDRDGTLTPEIGHIGASWRLRLLPETPAALRALRRAGYLLICVTNQSGVARGLYQRGSLERVLRCFAGLLEGAGTPLDAIYACPHHPRHGRRCRCRKPGTRMLRLAERDLGVDLARSVSIGDRWSDVVIGQRAGGRGILIERSRGRRGGGALRRNGGPPFIPDAVVADLLEAARLLASRAWDRRSRSVDRAAPRQAGPRGARRRRRRRSARGGAVSSSRRTGS